MSFRASFCDPFKPDIQELGEISPDQSIALFSQILWSELLQQMQKRPENEIYFSPSWELENQQNGHGLAISAVGEPTAYEFHIIYKRPKTRRFFFGLLAQYHSDYLTDVSGQTHQMALACLHALLCNDHDFLEQNIK